MELDTIYLVCFLAGGTLMVCQFLLSLVGLGGHDDVADSHDGGGHDGAAEADHDVHDAQHETHHESQHGSASFLFVRILTFRTLVAALTFFGLFGVVGSRSWWQGEPTTTFIAAVAAGAAAMFVVAWLMKSLSKLKAEGTVRIDRAVGKTATVYLPVPGHNAGAGKVMLKLQNRTVECQAVTSQQDLPTGAQVVVVAVLSPDTLEVAPVPEPGRTTHV